MKARKFRNLIGPQVRRLRCANGWSQEKLMFRLQEVGWNICRQRIARIESREAKVSDYEALLVAKALGVEMNDLLPRLEQEEPLYQALSHLLDGQIKSIASPEEILAERSLRCLPLELKEQ